MERSEGEKGRIVAQKEQRRAAKETSVDLGETRRRAAERRGTEGEEWT